MGDLTEFEQKINNFLKRHTNRMLGSCDYAPLTFYVDHEIYQNPDIPHMSLSMERPTEMIFPRELFGDLPQSFTSETFSSQCLDTPSFAIGSSSFTDPSFPQSLPEVDTKTEQPDVPVINSQNIHGNRIESLQVASFWEQYNEYPNFLKQLKKRLRRRNRRNRGKE